MRSQHQFSQVPRADIPRSSFNLSHGLKTSFDVDRLVPIMVCDIIPGDTFSVQIHHFCRLATPLFPILDNMFLDTQAFFVPYRTIWDDFEKFHGAQDDPGDSIVFTIPILSGSSAYAVGDLGDYMGLPTTLIPNDTDVSALPFRAYRKIYNEWHRDENLQNSETTLTDAGPDNNTKSGFEDVPLRRGKRFDYFTSCLPAPQKGSAVSIGLGSATAHVQTAGDVAADVGIWSIPKLDYHNLVDDGTVVDVSVIAGASAETNKMFVDTAANFTINDIRLAFQTQRLLERDARSGTRYVEVLKAHWGVTSPDHRLQRAEYLGGGSSPINVTPVQQNTSIDSTADPDGKDRHVGQLAGFGTVAGTHSFSKSFVEHGVLIILANVRGDITYSQGIDRMWSKSTRYDFFYPVLSGIGEQSVLNKEIWHFGTGGNDDLVFGYQERYGEYRHFNNRLSALMRPDSAGTLAAWHLSEDFVGLPTLGATFIKANTAVPLDRAIAVTTEPHFIGDFYFQIKAARPMPVYGIPGNLDRL